MSLFDVNQSDGLAKRFAYLATTYFDEPAEAKSAAAKIPLENLFRMLQMFRYEAFSDEPRSGILELEGFGDSNKGMGTEELWHLKIRSAMAEALSQAFEGIPVNDAALQVQATLSWLATNENPPDPDVRLRSKSFLERFLAALG